MINRAPTETKPSAMRHLSLATFICELGFLAVPAHSPSSSAASLSEFGGLDAANGSSIVEVHDLICRCYSCFSTSTPFGWRHLPTATAIRGFSCWGYEESVMVGFVVAKQDGLMICAVLVNHVGPELLRKCNLGISTCAILKPVKHVNQISSH